MTFSGLWKAALHRRNKIVAQRKRNWTGSDGIFLASYPTNLELR